MRASALVLFSSLCLVGCIKLPLGKGGEAFEEYRVGSSRAKAKVAVVDVVGIMTSESRPKGALEGPSENIVARTAEQLVRAGRDKAVKAVVVRISSPGGAVFPSLAIYRELKAFRRRFNKPIITYAPDVAASGGYLAALGTDGIMADDAAIVGSIGVIATMPNVTGLLALARVEMHTFKTGDLKDVGSPFRTMHDQDRQQIRGLIDHYFALFKELVGKERKLTTAQVAELATGGVFTAEEAHTAGLVDWVGDIHDAHARAAKLAGLTSSTTRLVIYRRPDEYHRSIYSPPSARGDVGIAEALSQLLTPTGLQLQFLWSPGAR